MNNKDLYDEIEEFYFRICRGREIEIEDNQNEDNTTDIPDIEDNNDNDNYNDNEWQETDKDNRDVDTDEHNKTNIPENEDNQDDDEDREEFVVGVNSFQHKLMKDIKTLRELRETLSSETNKIWTELINNEEVDPHSPKR